MEKINMAKKIMALQTARAGSKSVPDKNLYKLNNIPLYAYNVRNAVASKFIEKLYISTDSQEIINTCQKTKNDKIKLIVRPPELCQDTSHHYDAIIHGLNEIEKENGKIDILVVLLGNTPYAYTKDLDDAIDNFIFQDYYDSCMSVSTFNMFNPFRAFHKFDGTTIKPFVTQFIANQFLNQHGNKQLNDKNGYGDIYFFNGSFWIIKRETLLRNDGDSVFTWLGNKILPYEQREGIMEIDVSWQLDTLKP